MNTVILMGRLTDEPDIRVSSSGTKVARFSLAVDRRFKKDDTSTDFFNHVAFSKVAEFAQNYLHKGTKVVISGHIQNDSYTNKEGKKITNTVIYADSIEFAESKSSDTPKEKKPEFLNVEDIADLPFA